VAGSTKKKDDEKVVDKRRVTMTNAVAFTDEKGNAHTRSVQAIDFVRPDVLDAYVEDAGRRWQDVQVSDEPDAGPAGYDGATFIPFGTYSPEVDERGRWTGRGEWHEFPHELAGTFYPASDCKNCDHAPEHPLGVVAKALGQHRPEVGQRARTVREEA
jgi:hypothetical protein